MRATICGLSGQDGSYLARFLLDKGYEVWGTSRDPQGQKLSGLASLLVGNQVRVLSMDLEDFRSVLVALQRSRPDEIYFLAGQSSVGLSFEQPAETMQSIVTGTLNILEACRMLDWPVKLYSAGSSECFGNTKGAPATEETPFNPRSPYAVGKSSAFWLVDNYREAYRLHACTGILFNHESPLRNGRFVTQKIVGGVRRIAAGSKEKLMLGQLNIARDWGWAPEYVEAMWLMLQMPKPADYVIATGETHSLEAFVAEAFSLADLDWKDHVVQDESLFRPTDILISKADPSKAARELGWKATSRMRDVVGMMMEGL